MVNTGSLMIQLMLSSSSSSFFSFLLHDFFLNFSIPTLLTLKQVDV